MTAVMRASLMCDHPAGCTCSYDGADLTIGSARKRAAKEGWVYQLVPRTPGRPMHSIDLCPKHGGSRS